MVEINEELCIGCEKCAKDCIAYNIEVKDKKACIKRDCIKCGHCVAICPVGAVSIPEYDMDDVEVYETETFSMRPEQMLHSIKFRRSIRRYKAEKVKKADLEMLLQAGRYTATAKNNQDCCFVFVQDELEEFRSRVWDYIDEIEKKEGAHSPKEFHPYLAFNRRRKKNPKDDYLFRDAPTVLLIASDWELDAGLAAQNVENMAAAMGMGALFNGFLCRIADENRELKRWLGIEDKTIKACMLLGYPDVSYVRTAPRDKANVIWK